MRTILIGRSLMFSSAPAPCSREDEPLMLPRQGVYAYCYIRAKPEASLASEQAREAYRFQVHRPLLMAGILSPIVIAYLASGEWRATCARVLVRFSDLGSARRAFAKARYFSRGGWPGALKIISHGKLVSARW